MPVGNEKIEAGNNGIHAHEGAGDLCGIVLSIQDYEDLEDLAEPALKEKQRLDD